jgi:hypothetical protein
MDDGQPAERWFLLQEFIVLLRDEINTRGGAKVAVWL